MKYLKSINEYKFDIDEVILECKEILLELVHDGIEVSVYEAVNNTISVNISSSRNSITSKDHPNDIIYSKIKPSVEHLLSYMSEDFNCELYSAGVYESTPFTNWSNKSFNCIEEVEEGNYIDHLCFLFHFKN
jgi:hypothetical protein